MVQCISACSSPDSSKNGVRHHWSPRGPCLDNLYGYQLLCPFRIPSFPAWNWIETSSSLNSPTSDFQPQSLRIGLIGHGGQVPQTVFIQLLIAKPVILANYLLIRRMTTIDLTWMYGDLQGGESMIGCNLIISIAVNLYNTDSVLEIQCTKSVFIGFSSYPPLYSRLRTLMD